MLKFVTNYLAKKEGRKKYDEKLREFLSDSHLDKEEKKELEKIASKYGLTKEVLLEAQKSGFSLVFDEITSDKKITEEEKKSLDTLLKYFDVELEDVDFDQAAFNKYYTLALIDKGILPEIKKHDIDIIFKPGEMLHWGVSAALIRISRRTKTYHYRGPAASIKIMKGLRYRVGSINIDRETVEEPVTDDVGVLWMTNQRFGFIGKRKSFVMPYSKIHKLEVGAAMTIFKEGRQTPFLLVLDDYEVPSSIVSYMLNKQD